VDKVNRFPNKITEIIISAQRTSTRHVDHLPIQASISFNIKMEKKFASISEGMLPESTI
jgi:hypothetical protein